MPELPEVETTVRDLRPLASGRTIVRLWTDPKKPIKSIDGSSWSTIAKAAANQKIKTVRRHAKYIVLDLSGGESLYIHQKMSGHILFEPEQKPHKHVRMAIVLNNRHQIALSDPRRFGTLTLVGQRRIKAWNKIGTFGPDPLTMAQKQFQQMCGSRRGRLKQRLMDPTWISGIGNICADEILWHSGLHPLSRLEKLEPKQTAQLYKSMQHVLALAIKHRGSTIEDYRTVNGQAGSFQDHHRAYHQTGQACSRHDGGKITRIVVGARSTHFCPKHQLLIQ